MIRDEELGLTKTFLQVAACPQCHNGFAVDYDRQELVCVNAECALAFPIENGIPILLIDRARQTRKS